MMEQTLGHHRRTGLTRAKNIERLGLWLGLPLLLVLLSLTAGIVNYTPVRQSGTDARPDRRPAETAPAEQSAPGAPSMPLRPDRLAPAQPAEDLGQSLELAPAPVVS